MTFTRVILLLALLVASASCGPLLQPQVAQFNSIGRIDGDYRLPTNSLPNSYKLQLEPHMLEGNFTFNGNIDISLQVVEQTSIITLHTNALTYDEFLTTLVSDAGVPQIVSNHTYNDALQFLYIEVQNPLSPGNYTLSLFFVGILANDMYGFYRSSYTDESGNTVWLATTQFEPTSARRAFPCYDEPALKATFNISIKHEPQFHALSNMPIAEKYTDTDGKIWTIFETTPLISTYLIAFVVSDFLSIKNSDETYNVWTRPEAISDARYAFDIGQVELVELGNFTSVGYSLPKMDQISIPDFSAGAMENWGLVTYRESYFHYNENTSTLTTKQGIATVISHEFAHQWFGNLVSPYWWKYLWLNEGFATYFQYFTTDAVEDNWRLMDQFVVRVQHAVAFSYDSSATSHPMNQDVSSPSEISSLFDSISYQKAACVIRMLSHFLTEDVFKAGLTRYLNEKAYGAAVSDDLYAAMEVAATNASILPNHVYVKEILDTWVEQMGYPVVTVTRNYTTGTTEVSQARFLLGDADTADTHDYKWWVPLNWVSQATPDFTSTVALDWIREQDESVIISGFDAAGWVIFNKQQTGYYRVNYDDTNWGMLARYLNSDNYVNIHVLNRVALIDDAFNLARANRLSYPVALSVTLYLQREVDYIPWYSAFTGFAYLQRLLANTNDYESHRAYLAFLTSKVFESVGIEETDSDDHVTRFNRVNVINYSCAWGLVSCRSSAEAKLASWLSDSAANPIAPNLLSNTICAGLRGANATTWNNALNRYLTTESTTEQTALLAGLGCSEDEDIINNWLNAITDSTTGLSTAASMNAFIYVYQGSTYNVDRAFDFIVNNTERLVSYFGGNVAVQTFLLGTSYRMTTQAQLNKLNTFIAANTAILGTTPAIAVGYAESNIAWNAVYEPEISTWVLSTLSEIAIDSTTEASSTPADNGGTTTDGTSTTTDGGSTTTDDGSTTTDDSTTLEASTTEATDSAATASLSFLSVILVFICLVGMN